jgi:hypothetical protein
VQQHAQQLLGQADKEVAELKQQLAGLQAQLKDKSADIAVKDYDAETKRLAAVGNIDPLSTQIILRSLVQDIVQTELHPVLDAHTAIQGALQARMAPPQQQDPNALPPGLAQAHSVMDLAQKHADLVDTHAGIVNQHANTAATLNPPTAPAEEGAE